MVGSVMGVATVGGRALSDGRLAHACASEIKLYSFGPKASFKLEGETKGSAH